MNSQTLNFDNPISLPDAPLPVGNYVGAIGRDSLLYISGQLPLVNGQLAYRGSLGEDLDVETGYRAARLCAMNALAQMQKHLLSFDAVVGLARLDGYLQTVPDFHDHGKVLDGASDLLYQVLGKRGAHTRMAVGVASLPFDAPVELVLTLQISRLRERFWKRLIGSPQIKTLRSFDGRFVEGSIWSWDRMTLDREQQR